MTTDNLELTTPPNFEEEDKTEEQTAQLNADSTVEASPETDEPSSQDKTVTLEIDPEDVSGSLNRLMQEQPKVLNVINAMVGQKARTKWQPQVSELQLELDELRAAGAKKTLAQTPTEQVEKRLATDGKFRQQYDQVMASDETIAERRQAIAIENRILGDIETGISNGLAYDKGNELLEKVKSGGFDKDNEGNMLSTADAYQGFQSALFSELRGSSVVTEQKTVEPPTNPPTNIEEALDTATPDVSPSNDATTSGLTFTLDQVGKMTPDQFIDNFPDDDSYDKAIAEGRIAGLSEGVKDVFS